MTLGTAQNYEAVIHYQGGQHIWQRVAGLAHVEWGRKLDDFSEAHITVAKGRAGDQCSGRLGEVRTWGHELTLFRDNEFVWQGPITQKSEFRSRFEFSARDMLAWIDRRRNPFVYNWAAPDTSNPNPAAPIDAQRIIDILIRDAFREHDPGFLRGYESGYDLGTVATCQAMLVREKYIGDLVRDLIGHGIDMFTVGRRIIFWPERIARGNQPHRLTEADFLGDLEVREVGLDAATRAAVVGTAPQAPVDSSGQQQPSTIPAPVGVWPHPPAGVDPFFGLIERGSSSTTATTVDAAESLARLIAAYGNPPPVSIIVPAKTQLSPKCQLSIRDLVPARRLLVALQSYCTPVTQEFVFNEIEATADVSSRGEVSEQIQVSVTSKGSPEEAAA